MAAHVKTEAFMSPESDNRPVTGLTELSVSFPAPLIPSPWTDYLSVSTIASCGTGLTSHPAT
jgi:hypothetical protein